jgi:2-C-methyl-D-erythritol 4-phosphate cytidylyltransferase
MSAQHAPSPADTTISGGGAGAIVLAADPNESAGAFAPCWQLIDGKPMLSWSIAALAQTPSISALALVVSPHRLADARALASCEPWPPATVVPAGLSLCDSLLAGLTALPKSCAWVVVHDGARPLLTPALVSSMMAAARCIGAASAAAPVKETLKRVRDGLVRATPERARLALLQMPQVFARDILHTLLNTGDAHVDAPDAASLAVAAGISVATVPAGASSLKVTSPDDLALAADALAHMAPALGNGEDGRAR